MLKTLNGKFGKRIFLRCFTNLLQSFENKVIRKNHRAQINALRSYLIENSSDIFDNHNNLKERTELCLRICSILKDRSVFIVNIDNSLIRFWSNTNVIDTLRIEEEKLESLSIIIGYLSNLFAYQRSINSSKLNETQNLLDKYIGVAINNFAELFIDSVGDLKLKEIKKIVSMDYLSKVLKEKILQELVNKPLWRSNVKNTHLQLLLEILADLRIDKRTSIAKELDMLLVRYNPLALKGEDANFLKSFIPRSKIIGNIFPAFKEKIYKELSSSNIYSSTLYEILVRYPTTFMKGEKSLLNMIADNILIFVQSSNDIFKAIEFYHATAKINMMVFSEREALTKIIIQKLANYSEPIDEVFMLRLGKFLISLNNLRYFDFEGLEGVASLLSKNACFEEISEKRTDVVEVVFYQLSTTIVPETHEVFEKLIVSLEKKQSPPSILFLYSCCHLLKNHIFKNLSISSDTYWNGAQEEIHRRKSNIPVFISSRIPLIIESLLKHLEDSKDPSNWERKETILKNLFFIDKFIPLAQAQSESLRSKLVSYYSLSKDNLREKTMTSKSMLVRPVILQTKANDKQDSLLKFLELDLTSRNIRFVKEHKILLFHFDYYLPDYNTVIEYDGVFHFSRLHGSLVVKDQATRALIIEHGVRVFKISCKEKGTTEQKCRDISLMIERIIR